MNSPEKHHFGRLKGLVRRQRKKSLASVMLKYAAIFLISIIFLGTVTLSASAELRERFFDWVITTYEKYSSFGITSAEDDALPDLSRLRVFYAYLPEGFVYKEESINNASYQVVYENQDNEQLILTITPPNVAEQEPSAESIIWEELGFSLSLRTGLDYQTALKIAENMKLSVAPKVVDQSLRRISLDFLPEGFEITSEIETDIEQLVRYDHQNGTHVSVTITTPDSSQSLNTEGVTTENILVNGREAIRWRKNDTEFIVWEQQGYMLSLITELNQETALKIAENIRLL
jgi:hypothetical protein